ncbi:MAG: hypothetical protein N3F66_12245 [Spirochaetes bacterium]|nr:hypothetical protein [Spirochaetota bacterium]
MNPIASILQAIVRTLNRMIDSIDIRTQQSIKEGFFFLVFLLSIAAIFIGYNLGKQSAKPAGRPYAEITNDVFDLDIKMKKEPGSFQSMLESALMEQRQQLTDNKVAYPTKEDEAMTMPAKPLEIPKDVKEIQKPLSGLNDSKPVEPIIPDYTPPVVKPVDTMKANQGKQVTAPVKPQSQAPDIEKKETISPKSSKDLKPMDIRDKVFEQ